MSDNYCSRRRPGLPAMWYYIVLAFELDRVTPAALSATCDLSTSDNYLGPTELRGNEDKPAIPFSSNSKLRSS